MKSDESIECKLYDRIYSLKISIARIDEELNKFNFLTIDGIKYSQNLIRLKHFYLQELRSLEVVLL